MYTLIKSIAYRTSGWNSKEWHLNNSPKMAYMDESCPECNGVDIVTDFGAGDVICRDCGVVIGDRIIDETNELRTFANDDRGRELMGRSGDAVDPARGCNALDTIISNTTPSHKEMIKASIAVAGKTDRVHQSGLTQMNDLADQLSLPQSIIQVGSAIFSNAEKEFRYRTSQQISVAVAAVLFIACRKTGNVRSIKEFESASGVDKKKIGKTFKRIVRALDIEISTTTIEEFVEHYCSVLNLPPKAKRVAIEIARKAHAMEVTLGKTDATVAASVVYLVAAVMNMKRSLKEVAEVSTCAESTVRSLAKDLNRNRIMVRWFYDTIDIEY